MDDAVSKKILEELQKQRKMNRAVLIGLILFTGVAIIHIWVLEKSRSTPRPPSWSQVDSALSKNDYETALQIAQTLIGDRADDSYGEGYLGYIYSRSGDMEKAEAHFARAYELYPNEYNEKHLTACRKALELNSPQP